MELFIFGEYGQFIWTAFIFTFASCFFLYLKTKKELSRQEKMFLKEFKQRQIEKIKTTKKTEVLSGSPIF